jgi:hypothetical protein
MGDPASGGSYWVLSQATSYETALSRDADTG